MTDQYANPPNPLNERYASPDMRRIFSEHNKFSTWRRLWLALAESEAELGIHITDEQLGELRRHVNDINYDAARTKERETRHDVMAHVHAFGEQCPAAKPIIHLGATSSFVGDNTDIIVMRQGLLHIRNLLINAMAATADFAERYKALPTLAYTHFQPAQPTTLGKRAALWLNDLWLDLENLDFTLGRLKLLGCKGASGTAASFLELFGGDRRKCLELEQKIAVKMGFEPEMVVTVSGQTYSRKQDFYVLSVLSGIAQSAHKFSNDIRLMAHLKEVDEPFETSQIGSSAMAYKRNPMRSERMAALSRFIINAAQNPAMTAAEQWFERTLDDSANRRIVIPEAFLAADGLLGLYANVVRGLTVYPKVIDKHLREELPFMATENILMRCVMKGGDRQALHEKIRVHAFEAAAAVKEGKDNDLLARILADKDFGLAESEIADILAADFTGLASEQTETFLAAVSRVFADNPETPDADSVIQV